jgi:hypothetical protein
LTLPDHDGQLLGLEVRKTKGQRHYSKHVKGKVPRLLLGKLLRRKWWEDGRGQRVAASRNGGGREGGWRMKDEG